MSAFWIEALHTWRHPHEPNRAHESEAKHPRIVGSLIEPRLAERQAGTNHRLPAEDPSKRDPRLERKDAIGALARPTVC